MIRCLKTVYIEYYETGEKEMEHESLLGSVESLMEKELEHAKSKFSSMNSSHEGYAVILEEFEELQEEISNFQEKLQSLWKAVRTNSNNDQYESIKQMENLSGSIVKEGIQMGAMCKRFRGDLIDK
jgi:hypothetical protein